MFYIASKLLAFLIKPIIWVLILLISALIFKTKRRTLLIYTISIFWVFSNGFLADSCARLWETPRYAPIEIYDIGNDSWSTANDMPYDLSAYHLASFENFVFLFGDYDDHINEVNMYNANDDSWIKLSTNFTGRRHAAVVRNGDWIYVIAGWDGNTNYDIVEKCKPY